ncbi:acetoin utilization protein [Ignicoccus pacificus DSM 13166]|uniref:Acetoin utilization protein n=1 Tax=Ignicoccus pacificus DSM 13166 TaxID=940294 RepID=A0A977KAR8_9CREN|nr:acetoin utilization protein [Ignicoccus pacificus DSM 13166]
MERVLIIGDVFLKHRPPFKHPENPNRIAAILNLMKNTNIHDLAEVISPVMAKEEDLELIHDKEYITYVKELIESGGGMLDPDTYVSKDSWEPALAAAGSVSYAAEKVIEGRYYLAVAAVRPPGHHARRAQGRGFCLFNNVALAAEKLRRKGLKVAIVDIDVHWGDGTAYMFYNTDEVLYISTHQDPRTLYPFEGFPSQKGKGKGEGYTVNIALPPGTGDNEILKAFDKIILPILEAYSPNVILVSAGWDTHWEDPLAEFELTINGQWSLVNEIYAFAESLGIPIAVALEGGYVEWVVAKSTLNVLSAGEVPLFSEKPRKERLPEDEIDYYIQEVINELREYWPL